MCSEISVNSSASITRRDFLKLSGAGIAGVALAGLAGSGATLAQTEPSLMREFEAAAREYRVPAPLLIAMGYVNTRLEMPPASASEYHEGDLHGWGGYGIMALVRNPTSDTLGEAAELTGIPEKKLKTDRASNIRGGAALLARAMGGTGATRSNASAALEAVKGGGRYTAPAGVGGGALYVEQVIEALRSGIEETIGTGERVILPAQEVV
jgi:hypothetical protein